MTRLLRIARGRLNRSEPDRGSISLFAVVIVVALVAFIGVAVDLGGRVGERQRIADVANQAARAGGQAIDPGEAVRGESVTVDPGQAAAAARRYLSASGVDGGVSVDGDGRVTVTTSSSYDTRFLSLMGVGSLDVSATGTARTVRAVDGSEQ